MTLKPVAHTKERQSGKVRKEALSHRPSRNDLTGQVKVSRLVIIGLPSDGMPEAVAVGPFVHSNDRRGYRRLSGRNARFGTVLHLLGNMHISSDATYGFEQEGEQKNPPRLVIDAYHHSGAPWKGTPVDPARIIALLGVSPGRKVFVAAALRRTRLGPLELEVQVWWHPENAPRELRARAGTRNLVMLSRHEADRAWVTIYG